LAKKYLKKTEQYIYADEYLLVHNLEEVEGLVQSSGVEDAGKIPALDSTGKLDSSLIPSGGGGEEVDPIFSSSPAYGITADNIDDWNHARLERLGYV